MELNRIELSTSSLRTGRTGVKWILVTVRDTVTLIKSVAFVILYHPVLPCFRPYFQHESNTETCSQPLRRSKPNGKNFKKCNT